MCLSSDDSGRLGSGLDFRLAFQQFGNRKQLKTRPSALGMSDPIWGPLIHIFEDEKKKCEG